jgi:hypothetical protein
MSDATAVDFDIYHFDPATLAERKFLPLDRGAVTLKMTKPGCSKIILTTTWKGLFEAITG